MNLLDLMVKVGVQDEASGQIGGIASSITSALGTAAKVAAGLVAGATIAFAKGAVETGMQFDESFAGLAATMGTTTDQIQNLRDFALEMGRTTAFSASEAAEGLNYMALAGYDAETQMAMLPTVLNLAAAGSMDLAAASDMVTDAQSALGLSVDETTVMVDQMATAASTTNTSVAQLGEAILTVGGTAQYMSGGTAALSTALGILADNGIKGAEGGTHLRNIILSLANPTDQARAALEELGVQVFDADGNMRDFSEIFPELGAAMDGLTDEQRMQALATIFNKTDLSSVNALLGTTSERWDEVGAAIDGAQGSAEEMANTRLDSLAGDVTLMQSAFEGLQIAVFDKFSPMLRGFVQDATNWFSLVAAAISGDEEAMGQLVESMGPAGDAFMNMLAAVQPLAETWGPILSEAFSFLAENVLPILGEAIFNAITAFMEILTIVGQVVEEFPFLGAVIENAITTFNEIIEVVSLVVDALSTGFESARAVVEPVFQSMSDTAADWTSKIQGFFEEDVPAALDTAVNFFSDLPNRIATGLNDAKSRVREWASDLKNRAREAGSQFINNLINYVQQTPARLKAKLDEAIARVKAWAKDMGAKGREGANELKNKLIEGLRSIPSRVASIGGDIVRGIASGIRGAAGAVVSALGGVVSSAISAAKSRLGIASPSKVFRDEVGQWIPEGVAEGIYKTGEEIQNAFNDVMDFASYDVAATPSAVESLPYQKQSVVYNVYIDGDALGVNNRIASALGVLVEAVEQTHGMGRA